MRALLAISRALSLALLVGPLLTLSAGSVMAESMNHDQWNSLVTKHVKSIDNGHSTALDYAGIALDTVPFEGYLNQLSGVTQTEFDQWHKDRQLAFLINAYNAFTVALVLTKYPELDSIKDLGSLFSSPWKKRFIKLLGQSRSLDDIEHKLIRGSGRYNDPRIHFAVNCASIGCPALRAEAYVAERIDFQLQDQTNQFLLDTSRNRSENGRLEVSSIFKWYREDFEKGWMGFDSLETFFVAHRLELGMSDGQLTDLKAKKIAIEFLNYDWRLNDAR